MIGSCISSCGSKTRLSLVMAEILHAASSTNFFIGLTGRYYATQQLDRLNDQLIASYSAKKGAQKNTECMKANQDCQLDTPIK